MGDIGIIERESVNRLINDGDTIIGLLILAPADVADKCGVVINDPLATRLDGGIVAFILNVSLIEFVGFRICNESICRVERIGSWSGSTVIVVDDSLAELALNESAESIPSLSFQPKPLANGEGLGGI